MRKIVEKSMLGRAWVVADDNNYYGMASISHNPSINYVDKISFEIHIFEFNGDIYDQSVKVEFIDYLDNIIFFQNKEGLIRQLDKLKDKAYNLLKLA